MTSPKIRYETGPCGRCGGSGHYSYCTMYGTTCFKCGGAKTAYTRAGAKARAAVEAFITANFSKPVEALVVGDRVRMRGGAERRTVVTPPTTEGGSSYGTKDPVTGEMVWTPYVTVGFKSGSYGFIPGTMVALQPTGETFLTLIAFARTIKKGLTIVEPAATEAA